MIGKTVLLAMVFGATLTMTLLVPGDISRGSSVGSTEPNGIGPSPLASHVTTGLPARTSPAGIKVHGHWTLEVRDAKGTLVSRREFENALTTCGASALPGIIAGVVNFGEWSVSTSGFVLNESTTGLIVSFPTIGRDAGKVVLSGSFVNNQGSLLIEVVRTHPTIIAGRVGDFYGGGPSIGCDFGNNKFTERPLNRSVIVAEGQEVFVTVAISYF